MSARYQLANDQPRLRMPFVCQVAEEVEPEPADAATPSSSGRDEDGRSRIVGVVELSLLRDRQVLSAIKILGLSDYAYGE